jgi:maltose O-acetyltransferase
MNIKGKTFSIKQFTCLALYYCFLQYLPASTTPLIGKIARKLRYHCCKHIFKFCGKNVNIERRAVFGSGTELCIGDNSGLGINCVVPGDLFVGKDVMMGPHCYILGANHSFDRCDIPMIQQGHAVKMKTIIEDDVWIGRQVIFTPGRTVKRGSIIAAGCVLSKDFPEYSVVGGNPSQLLKSRISN